ncbi:MAG TPA: beta-galactosidase, partial [Candidatus Glassbacteria bacterium]|nr:beta-galactosidase [Candidatus Glassbacteria bacterium]
MTGRTFGLLLKSCLLQFILLATAHLSAGAQNAIPRPEHPQPQLERKDWLNLNGPWQFEIDPGNSGEERGLNLDAPYSRTIRVPFCPESSLSGVAYKDFMLAVWYRRSFDLPDSWQGRRIILHFGAVDYDAKVWVNGQPAGTHRGGYSPFSFDVTGLVKNEGNTVVVRAYDDTRSGLQPKGKQCSSYESRGVHYTRTTGIWQTVWLEAVGATCLKSFRVYPDADKGVVNLHLRLDGKTEGLKVRVRALAEGKPAGEITAPAQNLLPLYLPLTVRKLWNPGRPYLYDLEITVLDNAGRPVDQVKSYFGLRKVE